MSVYVCVFLFIFLRFVYVILNEYLCFIKIRKYNNLINVSRLRGCAGLNYFLNSDHSLIITYN